MIRESPSGETRGLSPAREGRYRRKPRFVGGFSTRKGLDGLAARWACLSAAGFAWGSAGFAWDAAGFAWDAAGFASGGAAFFVVAFFVGVFLSSCFGMSS
jgi:hypothetical protein